MPARTGCCSSTQYTVRKYLCSDGSTIWMADYFQGMPLAYTASLTTDYVAAFALAANTYANGSSGVGATLTSNANNRLTLSGGLLPTVGQSILVIAEATASHNGIYTVTATGQTGVSKFVLTRRTDFDTAAEMVLATLVQETHGGNQYVLTSTVTTVGSDSVTFVSSSVLGWGNRLVRTIAVDSNRVYVGGSRCTDSTLHKWSVVAFDIDDGSFLWDYDLGDDCAKILIDDSGNLVCMVENHQTIGSAPLARHFIRLDPTGSFIDDLSFTPGYSPAYGSTVTPLYPIDFCINEDGDYHILCQPYHTVFKSGGAYTDIYEWMSGFGSAPTLREFAQYASSPITGSIARIAGRDWVTYQSSGTPGRGTRTETGAVLRGLSQQAAWAATSDIDKRLFGDLFDNSIYALTAVTSTTNAAGTSAGTATTLTVNKDYQKFGGTSGAGYILPTGSTGDVIGFCRNALASGYWPGTFPPPLYKLYPPIGGTLNLDPTLASFQLDINSVGVAGSTFICVSAGHWVNNSGLAASQVQVDSGGNYRVAGYINEWKADSSRLLQWRNPTNYPPNPYWLVLDSSDNSYTMCGRTGSGVSLMKRNSSGTFVWGHKHLGTNGVVRYSTAVPTYATTSGLVRCNYAIQMDPDGLHVICAGFADDYSLAGPCSTANDLSNCSDPDPGPLVNEYTGGSYSYTTSKSGTLKIEVWGAGGGGGGGDGGSRGGGGGSGGYSLKIIVGIASGVTFTGSAGLAGTGSTGNDGTDGGDSTVSCASPSVSITAHGGTHGNVDDGSPAQAGGAGGTATGGDTNISGNAGYNGYDASAPGNGGDAVTGELGGLQANPDGNNGQSPGAGGGAGEGLAGAGGGGGYGLVRFTLS